MTTVPSSNLPEDESAFEQELRALYRAALLDETFQNQVVDSFHLLPAESQRMLHPREQALVQDIRLTNTTRAKLLDVMPLCQPASALACKPAKGWQRWLLPQWIMLPATLMAGLLLGSILPRFLLLPTLNNDLTRGQSQVSPSVPPASTPATGTMQQNPQQWLLNIAELLRQGKVAQARQELQAFELLYPGYQPPPSP